MKRKLLAIGTAILALGMLFSLPGCTKEGGTGIPAPKPVDEVIPDDDDDSGEGGGGEDSGTLCTDVGQKPMIVAYYTENSKALPDPTLLTHINYAHGRFGNPSTGDGGIVISDTGLMQKVIALKDKNPKLDRRLFGINMKLLPWWKNTSDEELAAMKELKQLKQKQKELKQEIRKIKRSLK